MVRMPRLAVLALALTACSGDANRDQSTATEHPAPAPADPVSVSPEEETQAPTPPEAPAAEVAEATPKAPVIETADAWLQAAFDELPAKLDPILDEPERFRFQVLVTEILPSDDGPIVHEHRHRVDAEYLYPASAIKTFATVAAMRVVQDLKADGHRVSLTTPVGLCVGTSTRCRKTEDTTNVDGGLITLGHEIRKMQLVSNNTAFNRLYAFVGHRELNEIVQSLGFTSFRAHHPLWTKRKRDAARETPQVELRPTRGKKVVRPHRASDFTPAPTPAPGLQIGTAHIDEEGTRVEAPMDFAEKNYVSLRDFHRLTVAIARPELPGAVDLGLDAKHSKFLRRAMTEDPQQSSNPVYDDPSLTHERFKPLLAGIAKTIPADRLRYLNKAGRAYGFHIENAYIKDKRSGRALVVTVGMYVNDNGVLNDNAYGYDRYSRPFFKAFGEALGKRLGGKSK